MTSNLISADIIGGLGNQLFQIAIVLEYSKKYNKTPIFKEKDLNEIEKLHEITAFSTLLNNNLNYLDTIKYNDIKFDNIYQEQIEYKKNDIPQFDGNVLLKGYYQSPYYLSDETKNYMNDILYSNNKYVMPAIEYYNKIKDLFRDNDDNNYCFVHFRRGDFLSYNFYTNIDYYKRALDIIGLNKKLIIFSDDIEWCKKEIKFNNKQFFVEFNATNINEIIEIRYIELILMSLFINGIVSPGSSFSYWASFIGIPNKNIVVSKILFNNNKDEILNKHNERYPKNWIEI